MATTRFADHLTSGTFASRPGASAVPTGSLYSATDTGVVYQSNGTAWSVYVAAPPSAGIAATIVDAKGDLIAASAADTVARLAVGSNNQVLVADNAQALGIKWAAVPGGGLAADPLWDAKGDLAVGSGADAASKLVIGADGQVLTADAAQTLGLKWATPAAGGGGGTGFTLWSGSGAPPAAGTGTAPAFVAAGALATGGTGTVTPALPAGIAINDVMLMIAEIFPATGTITPPAGWTLAGTLASGYKRAIYSKTVGAGETAPPITVVGTALSVRLAAWRQVNPASHFEVAPTYGAVQSTGGATSVALPSVTTLLANAKIVYLVQTDDTTLTYTSPNSATARLTEAGAGANRAIIHDLTVASPATLSGNWTVTSFTGGNNAVGSSMALACWQTSGLGVSGDWYLDTDTGDFYKRTGSVWSLVRQTANQLVQSNGTSRTARRKLNVIGATVTDDSANDRTTINLGGKDLELKVVDDATALTTGDGKLIFCVPAGLNGRDLTAAHAFVTTVSSSGLPTVQIRNVTDSVDMLTTRITIDASEFTSYTAAAAPVIDTTKDDVATGDLLAVDVDVAGTGAKGLGVILTFSLP